MNEFFYPEVIDFMIKITFSVIFASIIGLERELTGHKGSIKLNILVALGACIFSSYEWMMDINDNRISANIVTGVGFLCSGVIIRNGLNINGLSTAATLWCSAGVGILTSRGLFNEGLFSSVFLFCINFLLSVTISRIRPLKSFNDSKKDIHYTYNIVCLKTSASIVKQTIINNLSTLPDLNLEELTIKNITEDKVRVVSTVKIDFEKTETLESVLHTVDAIQGVFSTGWTKQDI